MNISHCIYVVPAHLLPIASCHVVYSPIASCHFVLATNEPMSDFLGLTQHGAEMHLHRCFAYK
jgi:hypothetical protein